MLLKQIATLLGKSLDGDVSITGISYDSRSVKDGDIFICLTGEKTDGHNHIKEAEAKGAKAIIAEKKIESSLPVIYVNDTQIALAKVANCFYGEPSEKIKIIGVTGTNGKTTTTHLIQHIFENNDLKTAVIGTLGTRENTKSDYYDAKHTTPQAPELQKQLANLVEKGFSHLAMEVSSHALSLHRVYENNFAGVLLTNITQDHLDFHLTMEEYWRAKRKLFEMLNISSWKNKYAIINKDDLLFDEFTKSLSREVKLFSYGVKNKADFQATNIEFSPHGYRLI